MRTVTSTDSTNISRVQYDLDQQTLLVQFKNGQQYEYFFVPAEKFGKLVSSKSMGEYFAKQIRDNYRYSKIA